MILTGDIMAMPLHTGGGRGYFTESSAYRNEPHVPGTRPGAGTAHSPGPEDAGVRREGEGEGTVRARAYGPAAPRARGTMGRAARGAVA